MPLFFRYKPGYIARLRKKRRAIRQWLLEQEDEILLQEKEKLELERHKKLLLEKRLEHEKTLHILHMATRRFTNAPKLNQFVYQGIQNKLRYRPF